jgi:large subunit ribosomal protein L17
MRHRKKFNHLGRKSDHRKAMLANMASSLILHKRITTTVAKAKALKIYVEPLITKSKEDSTHSRRVVFSYLKDKKAITELFREISPKVAGRPGGYTRILKTGTRLGDSAEMCFIELVDYNENMLGQKVDKAKTTARRSRKKKTTEAVATEKETKPKEKKVVEKAKSEAAKVEDAKNENTENEIDSTEENINPAE